MLSRPSSPEAASQSADPSARGSAPGSYDAKCVLTEPATCGLHGLGTKPAGVRGPPKVLEAHSAPNAFRKQYFGIVRGRWFAWFGQILLLFGCFASGPPKALDAKVLEAHSATLFA